MKIYIDLIKTFHFYKFNEFQCRISKFDEILFTPRLYNIGVTLHHIYTLGKIHALNGRSNSTPRKLTLKFSSPISNINVDVSFVKQQKIKK